MGNRPLFSRGYLLHGGPDALEVESSVIAQRSVVAAVWDGTSVKVRYGRRKAGEKSVGWEDLDGAGRSQG